MSQVLVEEKHLETLYGLATAFMAAEAGSDFSTVSFLLRTFANLTDEEVLETFDAVGPVVHNYLINKYNEQV